MLETLDHHLVAVLEGSSLFMALALSFVLGLRHATDPDHLVAVTTIVATEGRESPWRRSMALGAAWGFGHALTLLAFGLPVVLYGSLLPAAAQRAAEALIGVLIIALAARLLMRWRAGAYHAHAHAHGDDGVDHVHLHSHAPSKAHDSHHQAACRRPRTSFLVGLAHGMGGSAGVGVLLVASIDDRATAAAALAVLAVGTVVSMTVATGVLGRFLTTTRVQRRLSATIPLAGAASAAFGAWYAAAAYELIAYPF